MPPKHDQPAPAEAASSAFASGAALAGMRKRITWCTTERAPGRMLADVAYASSDSFGSSRKQR